MVAIVALSLVMGAYSGFMGWLLIQCIRADLELRRRGA